MFLIAGALHTGQGHTQIANFMATMNTPFMTQATFKCHERLVTPAIDQITIESCEEAIKLERELTLQNIDELKKFLLV